MIARAVWPALVAAAAAAEGARSVLRDPRWRRVDVDVDDPGVIRDVDTPEAVDGPW
ncbi:MAG: hypothetical protein H6708_31980 [Kofleriaceae bacterium]|nr:hypothetical protein [Kofleriaceae bacterium]